MSTFDENPFADPSVQRAVEGTGGNKANLDDYNPFDAQKNATSSGNAAGRSMEPWGRWMDGCKMECNECRSSFLQVESLCDHIEFRHRDARTSSKIFQLTKRSTHMCQICARPMLWERSTIEKHLKVRHCIESDQYHTMYMDDYSSDPKEILKKQKAYFDKTFRSMTNGVDIGSIDWGRWMDGCFFECTECTDTFKQKISLDEHLNVSHDVIKKSHDSKKPLRMVRYHFCQICATKLLWDRVYILNHLQKEHKTEPEVYQARYMSTYWNESGTYDEARNEQIQNAYRAANEGSGPAVMNPSSTHEEPPPTYTKTGQQQITTADFQRRQEELERRARDLERREEELKNTPYNARQNNWPPLPTWCPWGMKPCFYQDINVDIPVEFQKIVRNLYYLWVAHAALLLGNLVVGVLYLFVGGDSGQTFGLALIYWALYTPLSFICWFRPAYKAFRDDSSFNFMVFFFVFFFQFLISCIYALGIGSMGSCGFILGISKITQNESGGLVFAGVLMLITGFGFALCALGDFYLLVTIHKLYRSSDASMAKAQAEFTSGVLQNEQVQAAAAAAARETVRSQFNQAAAGGGGNNEAPRY